jgi:hypothetical protein
MMILEVVSFLGAHWLMLLQAGNFSGQYRVWQDY